MEDLRKKFREDIKKGERVNLGKLIEAYITEVIFEAVPTDVENNIAIAHLLEAYSKVEFLSYNDHRVG